MNTITLQIPDQQGYAKNILSIEYDENLDISTQQITFCKIAKQMYPQCAIFSIIPLTTECKKYFKKED